MWQNLQMGETDCLHDHLFLGAEVTKHADQRPSHRARPHLRARTGPGARGEGAAAGCRQPRLSVAASAAPSLSPHAPRQGNPPPRPPHTSLSPAPVSHNLSKPAPVRQHRRSRTSPLPRPAAARGLGHGHTSPAAEIVAAAAGRSAFPARLNRSHSHYVAEETNLKAEAPARLPPPRPAAHSRQAGGGGGAWGG